MKMHVMIVYEVSVEKHEFLWVTEDLIKKEIDLPRFPVPARLKFPPSVQSRVGDTVGIDTLAIEFDVEHDEPSEEVSAQIQNDLEITNDLRALAREADDQIGVIVSHIKLTQPWLGPLAAYPRRLEVHATDALGRSRAVPIGIDGERLMSVRATSGIDVGAIDEAIGSGFPSTEAALLADAQYATEYSDHPDWNRAVLFAAIAVEMRIKRVLRHDAPPDLAALIDRLIPERSPARLEVKEFFDTLLKVRFGRSLRDDEPDLFESVTQLFGVRNALVHRGVLPAPKQGEVAVMTALRTFDYLFSLNPAP